jgi:signal transduction histidine kinase
MPRFRLKTLVILTYLVIFLVSAAIVAGRAGSLFAQAALLSAQRALEAQAYVTASVLERPWIVRDPRGGPSTLPELQAVTERFGQSAKSQLNILDPLGDVLATSTSTIPASQASQPEVIAALAGWIEHDVRFDPVTRRGYIYAAAPIGRLGHIFGVVQLAQPLDDVLAQTRRFWLSLGLTVLLAAVASAIAGWLLAEQLTRPVARLRDAATRLAAGDLDQRVSETVRIAELAHLAAAFNYMAGRVKEMIHRQRAFIADASHELRTPLTNIKLRAEALSNGALEDATVAGRFVGEIESEADRLGRMANDLLTLSRQDAAPQPFRELVDPAVIVSEVVRQMALRAEKNGVALAQDLAPDLPMLYADPVGLRAALVNLVDNALQYTPGGGNVTVQGRADGQQVILQVADTGVGIPAEDLPHIFERFYRVDKARSRRSAVAGSGAGLGLAIVRGIVEEHDGTVSAESTIGQGTITVTLPVAGASG